MLGFPRRIAVALIEFYQGTLSPDHGPLHYLYPYGYCRHEPTCSMYAKHVIAKQGLIIGGIKALGRILTCVPWQKPSEKKIRKMLGV